MINKMYRINDKKKKNKIKTLKLKKVLDLIIFDSFYILPAFVRCHCGQRLRTVLKPFRREN